jgi:hypothetical protein
LRSQSKESKLEANLGNPTRKLILKKGQNEPKVNLTVITLKLDYVNSRTEVKLNRTEFWNEGRLCRMRQ